MNHTSPADKRLIIAATWWADRFGTADDSIAAQHISSAQRSAFETELAMRIWEAEEAGRASEPEDDDELIIVELRTAFAPEGLLAQVLDVAHILDAGLPDHLSMAIDGAIVVAQEGQHNTWTTIYDADLDQDREAEVSETATRRDRLSRSLRPN